MADVTKNQQSTRVEVPDDEWRGKLSPLEYRVARQGGTEPAFTGRYWNEKRAGTYRCVCCGAALFDSDAKFESGTGWPSFSEPAAGAPVVEREDASHGMVRTEVKCGRCDAHLGHVFPDGPPPSGARYCMNSAALSFEPAGSE